jgi:hypothetical protein
MNSGHIYFLGPRNEMIEIHLPRMIMATTILARFSSLVFNDRIPDFSLGSPGLFFVIFRVNPIGVVDLLPVTFFTRGIQTVLTRLVLGEPFTN